MATFSSTRAGRTCSGTSAPGGTASAFSAARACILAHVAVRKEREWDQVPAFWKHLDTPAP